MTIQEGEEEKESGDLTYNSPFGFHHSNSFRSRGKRLSAGELCRLFEMMIDAVRMGNISISDFNIAKWN
jgi:hypothetical protein